MQRARRHTTPMSVVDTSNTRRPGMAWDGKCNQCRRLMSICVCFDETSVAEEACDESTSNQPASGDHHHEKRHLLATLAQMHATRVRSKTYPTIYSRSSRAQTSADHRPASSKDDRARHGKKLPKGGHASSSCSRSRSEKSLSSHGRSMKRPTSVETTHDDSNQMCPQDASSAPPSHSMRSARPPVFDARRFAAKYYGENFPEVPVHSSSKSTFHSSSSSSLRSPPRNDSGYPIVWEL